MSEESPTHDVPDPSPARTAGAYALMLLTVVIWASAFAGIRAALTEIDAMSLTVARMTIASLTLGVVGLGLRIRLPRRRDLPIIAAAGLLGFTIYHVALNFGLVHVPAGQASFIIATIPIWTAVLTWRFLGERITPLNWVGMAVGLTGVAWMSLDIRDLDVSYGAMLVLLAALCAAGNITLQKLLLGRYRALEVTLHVMIAGTLPLLVYLPWAAPSLAAMSAQGWWITLYLGVIPIALGYLLGTVALSILPAYRNSQMLLLIPPIAALIAWVWLGEEPTTRLAIGGGLILTGVLLGGLPRWRRASKETQG